MFLSCFLSVSTCYKEVNCCFTLQIKKLETKSSTRGVFWGEWAILFCVKCEIYFIKREGAGIYYQLLQEVGIVVS